MNENCIAWPGQSGRTYPYYFINLSLPIDPVAANYAFVRREANGKYLPLYFGETDDAKARLTRSHEKWDAAVRLGATHLMAHATPGGEQVRCEEERDLIARWQPALNVQHRNAMLR